MTFPQQNLTVQDPGLNVTAPATRIPLVTGIATGGSAALKTLLSIGSIGDVRSKLGYGPAAEDVALALQKRGGPILCMLHDSADSKALSGQALTPPGSGSPPAITVSGTPNDRYSLRVEIVLGGARGTATFKYSLDAHDTDGSVFGGEALPFTESRVRTTAATYAIPNSGLTLAFPTGTYVAGHVYTLSCVPKEVGTTDLGDVAAALEANAAKNFFLWLVSGSQDSASTAAALAAALQGHCDALAATYRFVRAFIDLGSGDTDANVKTQALNWEGKRIQPDYGFNVVVSALPFEGFSYRKVSCVANVAVRAFREVISTDLSRFASGACDEVIAIKFDGGYDQGLDDLKIGTMRTWIGMPGFYIANAKLKSGFGSDFTDLQFGRVMDVACRTTYEAQLPFISESLRTVGADDATEDHPTGSIDERDAQAIERAVQQALDDKLRSPVNARGVPGHVSDVTYAVDRTVNLLTTSQLQTSVRIRPLGYSKDIETNLSFSLE
jgi:hypothetical protein